MSTVRNALAVRDQAAAEVQAQDPLHVVARKAIERQAVTLRKILPEHMTLERFEQITLAQIKATPKLLRCFETTEGQVSLLYSVIQVAAAGLEIGGLAQEAWLIPYEKSFKEGNAWRKRWEARAQLSDRGVRSLARQDPRVRELVADVVREGDHFINRRTLNGEVFEHEVTGPSSRPLTHAYCLIRWKDGGARAIVLDRDEVLSIRDRYSEGWKSEVDKAEDQRSNPWSTREARMWVKTAIHQARRELRLTPEIGAMLTDATSADDEPIAPMWPAVAEPEAEPPAIEPSYEPAPANEDGEPVEELTPDEPAELNRCTLDDLMKAGFVGGHWQADTGLGTARKRLVALANEYCGIDVSYPEEILADESAAEQLLAKLNEQVES